MTVVTAKKPFFNDWLIVRVFSSPEEGTEVCVLTTRGHTLARHERLYLRRGTYHGDIKKWLKVPGLRRYRTEMRAKAKAVKMNRAFNTTGFVAIREDQL